MITLTKGSLSVTLRNPDFGNSESIEARRILRKTRGGDVRVYRDSQWPKIGTIHYGFSYLKDTDLYKLQEFLKATMGQEITLTDYEGRIWLGVITTPDSEMSQPGISNYAAEFELETTSGIPGA